MSAPWDYLWEQLHRAITGVVVRVDQRAATIGTGDGATWRVPFHLLRHVLDI